MNPLRSLHQLTRREYETLAIMELLQENYPQATGEWEIDCRPPPAVAGRGRNELIGPRRSVRERAPVAVH